MTTPFEDLIQDIQNELIAIFLRKADRNPEHLVMAEATKIPWSWVAVNTASILSEYPTGLTKVVLLSILELSWERVFLKRFKGFEKDFATIQSVYESVNSETFLLEVSVKNWEAVQGTDIYYVTIVDGTSEREMDIYLHPKFSKWVTYMNFEFFINRTMRIVCPPKTNSPIINKYRDEKLEREHRIAIIPPTEYIIFILNQFDKNIVQQEFADRIRDISKKNKLKYSFWLKIIHVEIISHVSNTTSIEATKLNRTDIYLMDMSSDNQAVILSLYDEQSSLSPMFKRNDYIGLYNPLIQPPRGDLQETIFEYSSETIIFSMPEKEAQEAGLAKINLTSIVEDDQISSSDISKKDILKRDEEGFMDCEDYMSRIHVKDLNYCMLNVTLFGKVIGLANNNLYIDPNNANQKMDRYALRIADSTGTMDITLWEYSGRDSRKLRVGQYILLDKLVTSDKHANGNKRVWYVNGSVILGTKMYNISTLVSLLTSSEFRNVLPLWHVKETKKDHFQIEGTITGWKLYLKTQKQFVLSNINTTNTDFDFMDQSIGDRVTTKAHLGCLNPNKKINQKECEFCGCQINNEVVQVFRPKPSVADTTFERGWEGWIEWILDDGTSICNIYGGEETLLNVTAHHFKLMSHRSQINLLDSVVGLPIICSLTGTTTSTYRMDQMTLLEPTQQECRDMLEIMGKK